MSDNGCCECFKDQIASRVATFEKALHGASTQDTRVVRMSEGGAQPAFFEIEFEAPVSLPLPAFGHSCHFGLGLFVPVETPEMLLQNPSSCRRMRYGPANQVCPLKVLISHQGAKSQRRGGDFPTLVPWRLCGRKWNLAGRLHGMRSCSCSSSSLSIPANVAATVRTRPTRAGCRRPSHPAGRRFLNPCTLTEGTQSSPGEFANRQTNPSWGKAASRILDPRDSAPAIRARPRR